MIGSQNADGIVSLWYVHTTLKLPHKGPLHKMHGMIMFQRGCRPTLAACIIGLAARAWGRQVLSVDLVLRGEEDGRGGSTHSMEPESPVPTGRDSYQGVPLVEAASVPAAAMVSVAWPHSRI